ncbi:MAG TPA: ABC transporter permease [Vicinamibacterales bacterium]|nr:ABC transporter permease [Vicinamibacterales bacterium]
MRFYRALLHLYPKSFRHEYGAEMVAIFADRQRHTPAPMRLFVWLAVVPEVVFNAAALHWDLARQDIRYAMRSLGRSPGFAATAIIIVALGIGANTAVFSLADFMLIRPLPFHDPDRLIQVMERTPGYSGMELSPGNYRDWKRMNTVVSGMGTYTTLSRNLVDPNAPARLEVGWVSADLFPVLGVEPFIGRTFAAADDRPGAPGTVLLSYAFWQQRFAGDRSVLGRRIVLDDQSCTVIGVMPPDFHFPSTDVALWTPQRFDESMYEDRTNNFIVGVARLRPGVTIEQARADFVHVAAALERQYPRENQRTSATVTSLRGDLSSQARFLLLALCGAAACVLLIVCANLAGLLIARASGRRRELAVRAAIGAGRERLVRQLVTESLVLAAAGGVLGIAVATAALPLLTQLVPISLPIAHPPSVDLRVLAFAVILTLLTGIAFGLFPVLRIGSGVDVAGLAEGARAGAAKERARRVLVVAEVAGSVVLLVATGLLLRALLRVEAIDPGFQRTGVLTLRTDLPRPRYDKTAARAAFYDRVLADVRALPGVRAAGYISGLPLVRGGGIWSVALAGDAVVRNGDDTASLRFVTPGYFDAMGIRLLRGRDVQASDTNDRLHVAVVSASLVRRFWPDRDPIGRTFKMAFTERTIVGVVGDVHVRGLERTSEPQVYLPYRQIDDGSLVGYFPNDLAVRAAGDVTALAAPIRAIVHGADPELPVSDVRTTEQIVALGTAARDVQVRALAIFAALALLLAAIGIYGLLSFTVAQRTQEIGVRMALGADRWIIISLVAREAVALVAAGIVAGAVLAYAAAHALQALLAGIAPHDAPTFATAVAVSAALALSGSIVPAFRAAHVDPVRAIRQ